MAVVDVQNTAGDKVSEVDLNEDVFNVAVKSSVMHEVVKMQLANRRAGTASVKNRSEIKGSTKKLFRQKGTGNARAGSVQSPLRRGGGVVFGPKPKDWGYKVPKKVRRLALKMALSSRVQSGDLVVLDKFELEAIKTKKFVDIMNVLKLGKALIITNSPDENLEKSSRNIQGVKVLRADGLNVYDILKYPKLVLLEGSVKDIEGRLS
jgi:large subunit ribosomal protein L4